MRVLLIAGLLTVAAPAYATTISYSDFSSTSGLQVNGNAATATDASNRSVLRLTPSTTYQAGSAFTTSKIALNSTASFSTAFAFDINHAGGAGNGADGFVFTLQTTSNSVGGNGQGIGYNGLTNSIGIKFDTYQNSGDLSDNFLAVVENGDINGVAGTSVQSPYNLKGATDLYAWIDYNGANNDLQVRLSNVDIRPTAALIDYTVNIASILGTTSAYAGFTSATGGGYENNDILDFTLNNTYSPVAYQQVPEPSTLALGGVAMALFGFTRLRRRRA